VELYFRLMSVRRKSSASNLSRRKALKPDPRLSSSIRG
jgi:hypothetical protein